MSSAAFFLRCGTTEAALFPLCLMATALISLGSNVGDRAAALKQSLELLASVPEVRVAATSSFHQTRPAGGPASQEEYLNAVALLETGLPPLALLSVLQDVENQLGRVRDVRWGPRTIDLDLLLYDQVELDSPALTLPHPRMTFRRFVLEPAAEIAPEMVHPVCGNTVEGLLRHFNQSPRCLAISGVDRAGCLALTDIPQLLLTQASPPVVPNMGTDSLERCLLSSQRENGWLIVHGAESIALLGSVHPKLLMVLAGAGDLASHRQWVRTIYRGPTLWLPRCSPDELRDEVLAAIAAME